MQEIEEQLCKLDSDKCAMEVSYRPTASPLGVASESSRCPRSRPQDRVCELKEEVRLQYQRMHQLLEDDLRRAQEALDRAQARFCQENTAQILALGEQRLEAQKLLSSIHTAFTKAEELSFMKNTKPVKILTDRSAAAPARPSVPRLPDTRPLLNPACLHLVAGLRRAWAPVSLLTKWET